ncbi:proline-rich protein 30 [Acomys russatus]|uniref:proline-rich protein 30 n=1 Tax=Acomys russatus TaxID=60746 RepID=UPI0021E321D2|nr:proline-rich protein 30 [Acomys russatus]
MLSHNKDQVLQQTTVPPACPPLVLSKFVDSPPPNLGPGSPLHQSFPPFHLSLPPATQGPPSFPTLTHQNYTSFGENPLSLYPTSPANYQLCLSSSLIQSYLSQLQNSSPRACQSPPHSSRLTSGRHRSPPGGARGCVASKVDPALFKDLDAIIQTLVGRLGPHRIAIDLQLLFLQHMWLGTEGQVPVVAYPICLVCLQYRTPSCPTTKYKTVPRLLAYPQLRVPVRGQEAGPLQVSIGFGLCLPRGQAKALHLLPKKKQEGAESQGEALQRQKPATQAPSAQTTGAYSQAGRLRSADLQSPKSRQCPRPPPRWQIRRPSGLGTGSEARVPWQQVPLVLTRIGVVRLRRESQGARRVRTKRLRDPVSRASADRWFEVVVNRPAQRGPASSQRLRHRFRQLSKAGRGMSWVPRGWQ